MRPVRRDSETRHQTRELAQGSQHRAEVPDTARLQSLWARIIAHISGASGGVGHRALPALLAVVTVGALSVSCGGTGEENAPPPASMGGQLGFGGVILGGCDGDETLERKCSVYITQASGVTSCFSGVQYCDYGEWSDCISSDHDPRVE